MTSNSFKLACIQLAVGSNKRTNLDRAKGKILEAAREGANVVVLPVSVNIEVANHLVSTVIDRP